MQAIKITTDNVISVVDIDLNDFRSINREIECSLNEVVKTQIMFNWFKGPVVMLVDEEGLLRRRKINSVGSYMYGTLYHGSPIVGDIIFAVPDGEYLTGFAEAERVKENLIIEFPFLKEADNEQ